MELVATYRGVEVRARVEADGSVTVNGTSSDSLSSAANIARDAVLSSQGEPRKVETNGWTFWSFAEGSGGVRTMDAMRQAHLAAERKPHKV